MTTGARDAASWGSIAVASQTGAAADSSVSMLSAGAHAFSQENARFDPLRRFGMSAPLARSSRTTFLFGGKAHFGE
jgi:hypothetical protein